MYSLVKNAIVKILDMTDASKENSVDIIRVGG